MEKQACMHAHTHTHTPCCQHGHKFKVTVEGGIDVGIDSLVHAHSVGVGLQQGNQLLLDQLQHIKKLQLPLFRELYEGVGAPMNS